MGPIDVLRYIEIGVGVVTAITAAVTGALVLKYRKEMLTAELRRYEMKRRHVAKEEKELSHMRGNGVF